MANCICFNCKRPMDCTGEDLCDLCEYDREQILASFENATFEWLSDCCFSTYVLDLSIDERYGTTGFCQHCGDTASFHREVVS
jgi:hypothetical protein